MELKDRYLSTCKNKNLKQERKFTVNRKKSKSGKFGWEFTAHLGRSELSWLGAGDEKGNTGVCNDVKTEDHSLGCGMATTLMEICFTDYMVGSLDLENDKNFKKPSLLQWRQMAKENCQHVVYLVCATITVPDISCSAYFTAAINTMHTMMFSYDYETETMYLWNVANTQPKFKKDAARWNSHYGKEWYFCQCKKERISECQNM